jgi:hypothetical protein
MNRKRSFHELSESTQEKYVSLNYTRTWDDDTDDLFRNANEWTHVSVHGSNYANRQRIPSSQRKAYVAIQKELENLG